MGTPIPVLVRSIFKELSDIRIMARLIVLLTILVAYQAQARFGHLGDELNPVHPALVEKEPRMGAVFRSVDVTDRTTKKWWADLDNLRDSTTSKSQTEPPTVLSPKNSWLTSICKRK